ncbi:MAG: hypothetical protein FVQ81_07825 [Candidatus Glassbacteria bacterium]|nr:hypothetical protein [Candidatus Glassbacteria bacterium]
MEKIMLWEPDQDLRNALALYINNLGYKTVALGRATNFREAVELEQPLVCLLPVDLDKGTKVAFGHLDRKFDVKGVMSVILPEFVSDDSGELGPSGVVIDRISKPFGIRELADCLDKAMERKHKLVSSPFPWEQSLEVRALRNTGELKEALKLRYEVYREVGFLESSEHGLDLDPYDFKSTIFGAFITNGEQSELAGTIRIIQDTGFGLHRRQVAEVMAGNGIDPDAVEASVMSGSLPALQTFRLKQSDCRRLYTGFATDTSRSSVRVSTGVHELSRLVIGRRHRLNSAGMERRLYELVIAHCCAAAPKKNWFVIAVHPAKTRKYLRFGFQNISQLGIQAYIGIDQPAALMVWDLQRYLQLPNPFTTELDENIVEYNYRDSLVSAFPDRRVAIVE